MNNLYLNTGRILFCMFLISPIYPDAVKGDDTVEHWMTGLSHATWLFFMFFGECYHSVMGAQAPKLELIKAFIMDIAPLVFSICIFFGFQPRGVFMHIVGILLILGCLSYPLGSILYCQTYVDGACHVRYGVYIWISAYILLTLGILYAGINRKSKINNMDTEQISEGNSA